MKHRNFEQTRPVLVLFLLAAVALAGCGINDDDDDDNGGGGGGGSGIQRVFAVTTGNRLVSFNAEIPGTLLTNLAISGMQSGEQILGIDFRPDTGVLYALGSTSRLYILSTSSGALTQVGSGSFSPALSGSDFGFDFNPAVDRIRVVSNLGQNLRLNPADGTVVDGDSGTAGTQTDTALTAGSVVTGAAYDRNFSTAGTPGSTAAVTTLFGIDAGADTLVRQGGVDGSPSPDGGAITTIGALGVNTTANAGFDIHGVTGQAYAALSPTGAASSAFYTVNLASGAASLVGDIGGGELIRDIALPTPPRSRAYAVTTGNALLQFDISRASTGIGAGVIVGMETGDVVRGLDWRPASEDLVALASGASAAPAGSARLYRINQSTGQATLLNTLTADPADSSDPYTGLLGTLFGVDFNAAPDRLRVVSNVGQNLRVNVDNGRVTTDTALSGAGGATVAAVAYDGNFQGTATTRLFDIDTSTSPDRLLRQDPPNDGVLSAVGSLGAGIDSVDNAVGFDIVGGGRGLAYAVINVNPGPVSNLYRINLDTGAATLVTNGTINSFGTGQVTAFTVRLQEP